MAMPAMIVAAMIVPAVIVAAVIMVFVMRTGRMIVMMSAADDRLRRPVSSLSTAPRSATGQPRVAVPPLG